MSLPKQMVKQMDAFRKRVENEYDPNRSIDLYKSKYIKLKINRSIDPYSKERQNELFGLAHKWNVHEKLLVKWINQHGKRYVLRCIEIVDKRKGIRNRFSYLWTTIEKNVGKV